MNGSGDGLPAPREGPRPPDRAPRDAHAVLAECPRCERRTLRAGRAGDARVLRCERCSGNWVPVGSAGDLRRSLPSVGSLDRASLERVREAAADRNAVDGVRYLACPTCAERMYRRQFALGSGIVVDRCALHGVWFDGGELELAAAYFAAGGPHDAERRKTDHAPRAPSLPPSPDAARALAQLLLWLV